MTQSKKYNLRVYCDLKNIDYESEEAQEFFDKKFYEQLIIIKELKHNKPVEEREVKNYRSIIDIVRNNEF